MPEELTTKNKIEILSVGFAFGNPDSAGMSIYYGPHECTALFVSGITSSIGKKECEAMQKAIASALDGDMEPRPNLRAPRITPNDADCKGCPERRPGLVWTKEPPTVPGWYWYHRYFSSPRIVQLMYRGLDTDRLVVSFAGNEENEWVEDMVGWWAGPIPIPEEAE